MAKRLEVESFVLCEEIRHEINNKMMLLGVYTGDIVVPHVPAMLRFAMYLSLKGVTKGSHNFECFLEGAGGKTGFEGTIEALGTGEESAVILTPPLPLKIDGVGPLSWKIRFDKSKWITVTTRNVQLGNVVSPFEFAPEEANSTDTRA
jgi:hypothetical protein